MWKGEIVNKTNIEWCDYTWNPIMGCDRNCDYCYARKLNKRFKWIEDWNKPQFFPERLLELEKLKDNGKRIFVGSMCDIFGKNIPDKWIQMIITSIDCYDFKHNKFMFLTKNPSRYEDFKFPECIELGTTCESGENWYRVMRLYQTKLPNKKFVSIEPIQGDFSHITFKGMERDLVIVGAVTGCKDTITNEQYKQWVESINHPNIFIKSNLKKKLEEVK